MEEILLIIMIWRALRLRQQHQHHSLLIKKVNKLLRIQVRKYKYLTLRIYVADTTTKNKLTSSNSLQIDIIDDSDNALIWYFDISEIAGTVGNWYQLILDLETSSIFFSLFLIL